MNPIKNSSILSAYKNYLEALVFTYLDNFTELSHEYLNENDGNLPIHNHDLPVVGLRASIAAIKEAELSFHI